MFISYLNLNFLFRITSMANTYSMFSYLKFTSIWFLKQIFFALNLWFRVYNYLMLFWCKSLNQHMPNKLKFHFIFICLYLVLKVLKTALVFFYRHQNKQKKLLQDKIVNWWMDQLLVGSKLVCDKICFKKYTFKLLLSLIFKKKFIPTFVYRTVFLVK